LHLPAVIRHVGARVASSDAQPAPYRPGFVYRVVHSVVIPLVTTMWVRLRVQGREHIPRGVPFIVVSNHVDNNDSYVIGRYIPGTVHYLARPAGIQSRFLGRFWRAMQAIPADRDGLVQALTFLKAGDAVGVYPDGVITKQLQQAKAGAALLAVRAGVPVLPAAVWGTERVRIWPFPRGRRVEVHVCFGPTRTLRRADVRGHGLQEMADTLMTDVAAMLPSEYRGYYATAVEARQSTVPADGGAATSASRRVEAGAVKEEAS
jgi:1-acyl-sn-glycerol-3-phosphate acyltransferase